MLRADDLNSQFANGANIINALTNVNEAHSADLARKKQAEMDMLRFKTKIGDVDRQRQLELLKKYEDDSIFGGIKELMGMYKTENPIVTNAGGEYLDKQVNALTGQSPATREDNMLSILSQRGDRNMMDKASYNRMRSDLPNKNIDMNRALTPEESINTYTSPSGLKTNMNAQKKNTDVPIEQPRQEVKSKIVRGDVKSYIRKAYENGTFVEEFKGSYSDMDSQNLNMYKPLVDEAVANGDWKAADMLNRQYMANKRSIDKSWGDEEGKGGVDSLYSGPKRKADEPTVDVPITVTNKKNQKKTIKITIPKRMLKNLHSKETLEHIYHAGNMTPEWDIRNGNAWFSRDSNQDLEYDIFRRQDEEYARAQEDLQHGYGYALGDRSGGIVTANGKVVYPALKTNRAGMDE